MADAAPSPRRVLVTGLTSLRPFAMELENLGNFVIIEPFFRTLREAFPEAEIVTTLQLTEAYERHAGIRVLRNRRLWGKGRVTTVLAGVALAVGHVLRAARKLTRLRLSWLTRLSARLREIDRADLVLDFSGDMFGDNAHGPRHLFLGRVTPRLAELAGTPCYAVASSPGPFTIGRAEEAARDALPRYRFVSTREPISLEMIHGLGLRDERFRCHACPSFGFRPLPDTPSFEALAEREPVLQGEGPLVGLILADLNMEAPPLYRWPRDDAEFTPFVELVRYMAEELGVRVCVMSHQNKTRRDFSLVPGPDHRVVGRLLELVGPHEKVGTLQGLYEASEMNRIIGGMDALVSGRIHGAVQGISQAVPTAIIDYRLPPPAHKLRGFARKAGLDPYVCDPRDPAGMREAVGRLWRERAEVRRQLEARVPELVAESNALWREIREDWGRTPAGRDGRG